MYDIKVINGKVYDFATGKESIYDIGIKDGIIQAIGTTIGDGKQEINADGNVVSPGFIDIHMHEEVIGNTSDGDDYDIANKMLRMGVTTCVAGNCGNNRQDVKTFLEFVDQNGAPVNYLSFTGHNYLRDNVGIKDRYRAASNQELDKMRRLLVDDIKNNGSIGISFGLEYSPGIPFDEIVELTKAVDDEDILLSAHFRKDAKYGIPSIKELIEISKATKKPMQISHIGSCTGFGMMDEALEIVQQAIDAGVDMAADCYPYNAFSTFIGSAVFDEGCFELWNKSYDSILLTEEPYKGVRCNKELFYKVRKEYPNMLVVAFVMEEEDIIKALKSPFVSVASDGIYRRGQGHPRGAGSFPRVLGRYVREQKELPLVEALKKMTLIPSERLGLKNKGEIQEGKDADIVIFNSDIIIDRATFEEPVLPPEGINYVILNGQIVLKDKNIIKARQGRTIKRKELLGWRNRNDR